MKTKSIKHSLSYIALALGLTWLFWITAALISQSLIGPGVLVSGLHYAGGAVPFLLTIFYLWRFNDKSDRADYWQRVFDFRRISLLWYGVILLIVPVFTFFSAGMDRLLGGFGLAPAALAESSGFALLSLAFFLFVFGPLPEELAWRGYLQERLQQHWQPLKAGVIIGIVWLIWHLPLFWIVGSYQHSLGIGTLPFYLFVLDKIPMSIVFAWIMSRTRNSTLSAILLHFMINFVGELFDLSLKAEIFYISLWWLLAAVLWLRRDT